MASDSSESEGDSNPRIGDYEDQITESLLACLQKITMHSENGANGGNPKNSEFNKDQIKELITCVIKIINTLYQSLKKKRKHKGRNLIKKRNRAKNAKVYNSRDVIRELCNTIKNIGCSATDKNQAEDPSLAKVVARTFRSQIPAVAGSSRSNTEAIPGTSRGHTEAIPGTSRSHTEAIPGTSRSHTGAIPGATRNHTEAIPGTSGSHAEAIPGTSGSHAEAIPGTSGSHAEAIPGTSGSHAEAIPGTSGSQTEATAGTLRSDAEAAVTEKLTNPNRAVTEASRNHTEAGLTEIPKSLTHRDSGTPIRHSAETAVGFPELIRARSIMCWPPTSHTKPILGSPRRYNEKMTETSKKLQKDVGNTSGHPKPVLAENEITQEIPEQPRSVKRKRTRNSALVKIIDISYDSIAEPTQEKFPNTPLTHEISQEIPMDVEPRELTRNRKRNSALVKITDISYDSIAEPTQEKFPNTPLTHEISQEIPVDVEPRELARNRKRNSALVKITDISYDTIAEPTQEKFPNTPLTHEISQEIPVDVEPRELTRNRKRNSALVKITDISYDSIAEPTQEKFPNTPLTHEISQEIPVDVEPRELTRNRKRNSALVKITDISYDSIAEPTQEKFPNTPLTHEISQEIPVDVEPRELTWKRKRNSALVKITDMDVRNQAVATKMTARSESTLNRHIEQGSESSSLTKITNTNKDNKSTDDSKNCALNGRTEETITNSTPTKIADAQKYKKSEDVKKINILKVIEKPDSTPKSTNEQAASNSTPVKTTENDKENKSVDENKRKTTKAKDSTQNAHVERVVTNSTVTNDKQAADAKKTIATRSDKSDSMRNECIEETTSNSTLTKISDTKKAEELMNGKKKKIEKDFGSLKNRNIDLISGNDFDEPKAPTKTLKKGSSGPVNEDKKIEGELMIYISDDTCFYNPAEEKNQCMKVIQEPVPKLEDIDQVLKDQQVTDVDEDTCLYDLAQEESTITNSGPKSTNHGEISKDEQVIDLSEDTCIYEDSQLKTSRENKKSSPKKKCDDEIMNVEQTTNSIQEICLSEGENDSATNLEPNKGTNEHRTELLEEREVKCAEYLLATNVKKGQASKNPESSNTVVISSFFHAPPNQNNQKSNHKSSEQNTTHIKQKLQGNCNWIQKPHDKVTHARKRPYEESKTEKNKLKVDKIMPEVTITTKTPDSCVTTSPTVIPTPKKPKTIRPSSEGHTSDAPVNKPELSISELSIRPPNRPLTHSAIESILLQAAQIAIPNLSITTSTASSEYRTQAMETPSAKLNPVTSKRPSTDSRQSTTRDETKPGQLTNHGQMNADIHQNVLLPSDPSVSSSLIMQNIAKSDCRPNASSNSSPQYRHTESRPGKPKPINTTDLGQFSKHTKSSEQPTDSLQKKARTVLPAPVSEKRSDSSNFTSTSAESRPEKPKSITKAAKPPTTDSGQFSKTNTRTKPSEQPTDSFEKKARTVPPGTVSETSSSATQQRAQIKRPDSSNFTSTSAESRPENPKPVTIASKRPSSDSRQFSKTNTSAKPRQQKANPIQNGQINQAAGSSEWRPASLTSKILLSPSQHRNSGNTISLSTNGLDFAARQPTNPRPVTSQSTSHAAQASAKLASSPPQVHSAPSQNSNSNRRETTSINVQTPQIDWYKPVPLQNLPNWDSRNLHSNVSKAHLNRKSSTKNHSHPIQSWHTPVLPGNEPDLPQTTSSQSPSHQSSLPHHLRLRPLIQEQPAYQISPNGRTMEGAIRQLNSPMRPLLVPKNQAAMMDNQKATIATQPTWHIPTEATDS